MIQLKYTRAQWLWGENKQTTKGGKVFVGWFADPAVGRRDEPWAKIGAAGRDNNGGEGVNMG